MLLRPAVLIAALIVSSPGAYGASSPSLTALVSSQQTATQEAPAHAPDVIFVPTPEAVVNAMLQLGNVTKNDVVYDLGCGDGRIVIAAAKQFGARGVGIDIDPQRIKEATANAQAAGVTGAVQFKQADLFTTDISPATVVTLYLLPSLNVKLMPKLMKELKPGTRVVSHAFDMGEWKPDQEQTVEGRRIFLWTIPQPK